MTKAGLRARERTVEVSPEVLGQICPETRLAGPRSRWPTLRVGIRLRARLLATRIRFRLKDLRPLWSRITGWRLRARIAWMRLRYRDRLH